MELGLLHSKKKKYPKACFTQMSSRTIKKLENSSLASGKEGPIEKSPEVSSDEEDFVDKKKTFNTFSLLNEGSGDEGDEDGNEREHIEADEGNHNVKIEPSKDTEPTKKKLGRKKKSGAKNKRKRKNSDEVLDQILEDMKKREGNKEGGPEKKGSAVEEEVTDFEKQYDEDLNTSADYDSNFKRFTQYKLKQSLPLLYVNSLKNLDPDQELRLLFGDLSPETIDDANSTTSLGISPELLSQFRKLAKMIRGWGGKDRRSVPGTSRKLLLTKVRDDWLPTTQRLIIMEEIKREDIVDYLSYKEDTLTNEELETKVNKELSLGVRYFNFEKINTKQDRIANARFYASVVMTPDPESLMILLQQYPYHVETLLQVAMILVRQGGNKAASNALVERCLFVFDRAFGKKAHEIISQGKLGLARLPYEHFPNRQFYLCLFRYITSLGERSIFKTAFNFCKLLLALSPAEDPLGVRYFIDFYAIMCEEYGYLINFTQSYLTTTYQKWFTPGLAFSKALAYFNLDQKEEAKQLLEEAFCRHPYVAFKLLETTGLCRSMPVKELSISTDDESLLAAETYLVRAALLWNDQSKKQFLHDELMRLFQNLKVSSEDSSLFKKVCGFFSNKQEKSLVNEVPYNLLRFAILSGENKIMARVPQSVWSRDDIFEYDVLPPRDNTLRYNEFTGTKQNDARVVDTMLTYVDQNIMAAILEKDTEADEFAQLLEQLRIQDENEEHERPETLD